MFGFLAIIFISIVITIVLVLRYKFVKHDEFILKSIMSLSTAFLSVFLGLYLNTMQNRSQEIERTKQLINVAQIDLYSTTQKSKELYTNQYSEFYKKYLVSIGQSFVKLKTTQPSDFRHPFPTMVGNLLNSETCLKNMSPSSIYYLAKYYDEMKNEMLAALNLHRLSNDSAYIDNLRRYYHYQLLLSSVLRNEKRYLEGGLEKDLLRLENAKLEVKITTFCEDNKYNKLFDGDLKQMVIAPPKGS